jgi:hypothetical protein
MTDAIFLSAGVPDPKRGPSYAATADTVAITSAVSALLHVTLGRRILVWGGQPAITPMIWVIAQAIGVDYSQWVKLYQTEFFKDEFPEDNQRFKNVTFTPNVGGDRTTSLSLMRRKMFSENSFRAGVFIGGMAGIVEEFELFRTYQPNATVIPVASTGGATLEVADLMGPLPKDLTEERDYVALFHKHLGVSVREERFSTPAIQPAAVESRYWQPKREF